MTGTLFLGLGGGVSPRTLLFVGVLVVVVVVNAFFYSRMKRKEKEKPGMRIWYEVPGKTPAECRAVLTARDAADLLTVGLEPARDGGWYLHFLRHNETEQPLDTIYRLRLEEGNPTLLVLAFEREAFGMREPVLPEELLDEYFAAKLGAKRTKPALTGKDNA